MKKFISIALVAMSSHSYSQNNVGIGITSPAASAALDITSTSKGLLIPRMTTAERSAIAAPAKGLMVFDTNTNSFWFHNGTTWTEMNGGSGSSPHWASNGNNIYNNNAGNIGIGTATPAYKLDLLGRMRFQHNGGTVTAGAWYDGTTLPARSFIGTLDDNHMGIFGTGGAGWNFVMNVNNGNVGVGTSAPTAKLDVNGALRIRQTGATAGSSLHATDDLGNAKWFAPMAFKVLGYSAASSFVFPPNSWYEVNFGSSISYNHGGGYSSGVSEFVAPVKGLYHFSSQLSTGGQAITAIEQRLRLRRVGILGTLAVSSERSVVNFYKVPSLLDVDVELNAGDSVWIEVYGETTSSYYIISGNIEETWFSGRLLFPL